MSQAHRLMYIHNQLRTGRPVTSRRLQEALEVSRATVMRDIEYLRDRLGVPIMYDGALKTYRIEPPKDRQDAASMPGMWLSPEEAYSFLTLYNIARGFDPGILQSFLDPFRRAIKQFLIESRFKVKGFDQKIRLELPFEPQALRARSLSRLSFALANDVPVNLKARRSCGTEVQGRYLVQTLTLRLDGWWASLAQEEDVASVVELKARDIEDIILDFEE